MSVEDESLVLFESFCAFLIARVQTKHLRLLVELAQEYVAAEDTALRAFVSLGAQLIAVLPLDTTRADHVEEARQVLADQAIACAKAPGVTLELMEYMHGFFSYLDGHVATNNLYLLRIFFDEFCLGEEDELTKFVACACEVVSVIPEKHRVGAKRKRSAEVVTPSPCQTSCAPQFDVPCEEQRPLSPVEKPVLSRSPHEPSEEIEGSNTGLGDLKATIWQRIRLIEVCEPWKQAFDPDRLKLPFDEERYPTLARNLRRFWRMHARAVWERHFWAPVTAATHPEESRRRKVRQATARSCFEKTVLLPAAHTFGVRFFYLMDKRKRHEGWWYRPARVNLVAMCRELGTSQCWAYLQSQMYARFPELPLGSEALLVFPDRYCSSSRSMWSSSDRLEHYVRKIELYKREVHNAEKEF